jgi:hypothetical protein
MPTLQPFIVNSKPGNTETSPSESPQIGQTLKTSSTVFLPTQGENWCVSFQLCDKILKNNKLKEKWLILAHSFGGFHP